MFRGIRQMIIGGGNASVVVNGQSYNVSGGDVSIINGKVFVNGKEATQEGKKIDKHTVINVIIEGSVESIECNGSVTVTGDVKGDIDCGGSATITGREVEGDISAGGSVSIRGGHTGSISCGGSISIR